MRLMFIGTERLMMQLIMVVLYRGLVMIGFMLYSNGGGNVLVVTLLVLFGFVSSAVDIPMYSLMLVLVLLLTVL